VVTANLYLSSNVLLSGYDHLLMSYSIESAIPPNASYAIKVPSSVEIQGKWSDISSYCGPTFLVLGLTAPQTNFKTIFGTAFQLEVNLDCNWGTRTATPILVLLALNSVFLCT
jgi:hypothetical protein